MGIFYAAYLGKKYVQRRQGITTNQIGKGTKPKKVILIENIMGWATFAVIPVETVSIILFPNMTLVPALRECPALQWVGLAVSRSLHRTAVVRITLTEPPVGKRKQYDANGDEMTYGRME